MPAGNYNTQTQAISGESFERSLPGGANQTENAINNQAAVSTTDTTFTTNTTLANVTGLAVNVVAGATYAFKARIKGTATANGGAKFAIGGTCTATTVGYTCKNYNAATLNANTSATTLGTAVGAGTAVLTDAVIEGSIVVNQGGTLTVQAAQNTSHTDTTTISAMSNLVLTRVA